jgi:hypothetical protein
VPSRATDLPAFFALSLAAPTQIQFPADQVCLFQGGKREYRIEFLTLTMHMVTEMSLQIAYNFGNAITL